MRVDSINTKGAEMIDVGTSDCGPNIDLACSRKLDLLCLQHYVPHVCFI